MRKLLQNFSFSWTITITCTLLALVMVRLSFWQWNRYLAKVELVRTYENNATAPPLAFPTNGLMTADFDEVVDKKISLIGRYDYEHQVIVTNKKYANEKFPAQPGHFLFTPFLLEGEKRAVMVSRGFIPFADLTVDSWKKYDFDPSSEKLYGVVKRSISPMFLGPRNPSVGEGQPFQRKFFYEEIPKMGAQLPYPLLTAIYIQRLGEPPTGIFPAEAVSVEIPPSTHRGYTIEWGVLAFSTMAIGFLLQAFPQYRGKMREGLEVLRFSERNERTDARDDRVLH